MSQHSFILDAEFIQLPPAMADGVGRTQQTYAKRNLSSQTHSMRALWIGLAVLVTSFFSVSFYAGYAHYSDSYHAAQQGLFKEYR